MIKTEQAFASNLYQLALPRGIFYVQRNDMPLSPDTQAIIAAVRETKGDVDRKIDEAIREIKELRDGFPDGDPDSHRRYHESVIEWRELRNKMVRDALTHAAKVGGIGAACWVVYAIWTAFKMEVTR